jgi:hypothetical protein
MFWTIVGALVLVFFVAPLVLQVLGAIIGSFFEEGNKTVGCIGLVVILVVILLIIF